MAILFFIFICLVLSVYLFMYQMGVEAKEKPRLPTEALQEEVGSNLAEGIYKASASRSLLFLTKKHKDWDEQLKVPKIRRKLIQAGSPMGGVEFVFFKALGMMLAPTVVLIFASGKKSPLPAIMVAVAIGYILPDFLLKQKIAKRQHSIIKDLPNIIDLLTLCVGGGMDFMLAVNRVLKELKPGVLSQELATMIHQIQMGKTRREALKDLAWRIDMPEVHSFARTLIQADRMGSPLSEALKLQAEEVRMRRFHRGEAMALKAPIKLLLPLFVFILPVVMVVVAGPIILNFMRGGLGM